MRDAEGVRAHLANQREVFALVRLADRPAFVETILMAADAVQAEMPAVEEEALVRVERKETQAERLLDAVAQRATLVNLDVNSIEVRVAHAVPEVRAFERDLLDDLTFAVRCELRRRLRLLHGQAPRVHDERANF